MATESMGNLDSGGMLLSSQEVLLDLPLPRLFDKGQAVHLRADSDELSGSSEQDKEQLRQGCQLLQQCQERVDQLGLFSANEELEDVTTADLKYILVPYMLGDLLQRLGEPERRSAIRGARLHLMAFISQCEQLGLLPEIERTAMAREGPADPATRRIEKIARFRRQKDTQHRLQEVWRSRAERQLRRQRNRSHGVDGEEGEEGEDALEDEQEERKARLLEIDLAAAKALDLLEGGQREETMLAAAAFMQQEDQDNGAGSREMLDRRHKKVEDWHRSAQRLAEQGVPSKAQPITCATFAQDVIEGRAPANHPHKHHGPSLGFGPQSLQGGALPQTHRERLHAQVFQPSHGLPRMSIEQAGKKEMEIMAAINRRTGALGPQPGDPPAGGEDLGDKDEDDEAALAKTRSWDDWKDDHPRGIGNSKLTPCG